MPRWLRLLLLLALLLGLLAALLLGTGAGTRVVLGVVRDQIPGLSYGAAHGRLGGTVVVEDVRWQGNGVEVAIRRLSLEPELMALIGGTLGFARIDAQGLRVRTGGSDSGADAGAARSPWPRIPVTPLVLRDAQWTDGRNTVALDAASAEVGLSQPRLIVEALDAQGPSGRVQGALTLDLEHWLPEGNARFDWQIEGRRLQGALQGERQRESARATLQLDAPWRLTAIASTDPRRPWSRWEGSLEVPPQHFAELPAAIAAAPARLSLSARADGVRIHASGSFGANDHEWQLDEAQLVRNGDEWRIDALHLREAAGDGELRLAGNLRPGAPRALDLQATATALALPWPGIPVALRVDGALAVAGDDHEYVFEPDLMVSVPDMPKGRLGGSVTLGPDAILLQPLLLEVGSGSFTAVGQVPRAAEAEGALAVVAQAFDPAVLLPEWSGRLDGAIAFRGTGLGAGVPTGTVQVQTLQGHLRQRAVNADGSVALVAGVPGRTRMVVRSGTARLEIEGEVQASNAIELRLQAPNLADIAPGWSGALSLDAELDRREIQWPRRARLDASRLALPGIAAASVQASFAASAGSTGSIDLGLAGSGIEVAGLVLDRARLDAHGLLRQHTIAIALEREAATLQARAEGGWTGADWNGRLLSLQAVPAIDVPLAMEAPAPLRLGADSIQLGPLCLAGAGGRLCGGIDGNAAQGQAQARLQALPLAAIAHFIPLPEDVSLEGAADGEASVAWASGRPLAIDASLRSERGRWLDQRSDGVDVGFDGLAVEAAWRDGMGSARLAAELLPAGSLRATLDHDAADALRPWHAVVNAQIPRIDWIEEFAPQFDATAGSARVEVEWRGGGEAPAQIRTDGRIEGVAGVLPGLGVQVADGNVTLQQDGDQLAIEGSVVSGGGTLRLSGRYDPRATQRLLLELGGLDVEVANLPEARLRVTPDLRLAYDGELVRLSGKIVIPSARIDVSRLESGARRSGDVVIIDDPPTAAAARRRWRASIEVVLGGDVAVQGFGFDGNVIGLVTVNQRSGRPATGSGELTVDGRYTALGQNFDIEGGRLLFSGGALDNPSLSLRGVQRFGDRSTTVRITGTAASPELHLSSPDSALEIDALAALMGRSGTFAFGRYLTPRLYVGYGVGLISGGEVFSVRYRINHLFDVEGTSGAENRAAINYRIER